ncbi:MAG: DUF1292 domain-containing protein [Clostridia bacterium]|nr:DUF1292 domain-containing protein [Clostridia bacterium]
MNKDKNFLTFTEDDGSQTTYEVIDECVINGSTYVAITPTEYYVLKKVQVGKKEDIYQPVDGGELEAVCQVFDKRINVIDHDNKN